MTPRGNRACASKRTAGGVLARWHVPNHLCFGGLGAVMGLLAVVDGQTGSGSSAVGDDFVAEGGADVDDGFFPSDVSWLNIAELVLNSVVLLVGIVGLLWHFTTFNEWIDNTLTAAEGAATAGLGMAAGGVTGTIKTAQDSVTTLTETATSAAEMASPVNLVGSLARAGSSLAGSDGSASPREGRRSLAFDTDLTDDPMAEDMSGSFSRSPMSASPRDAKAALAFGGRQITRGVTEANQLATGTVTTGIKVIASH